MPTAFSALNRATCILLRRIAVKFKSERGQSLVLIALAVVGIAALIAIFTGNLPGMKKGADAIGESVGGQIDDLSTPVNVMSYWVNNQRIYPNEHARNRHDVEADKATNCYNDHGAYFIQANKQDDWYIHCLEEDGRTVRTTIWKRVGNQFHMQSAYTKADGNWSWGQIKTYFENTWGASKATFPADGVLYIDNAPAPYTP
jgi:hypothetical protein